MNGIEFIWQTTYLIKLNKRKMTLTRLQVCTTFSCKLSIVQQIYGILAPGFQFEQLEEII